MKIRFQPSRGTPYMVLRDIMGGGKLARWEAGEEREIPADLKVTWQSGQETPHPIDAITAIFRHGPDFVDAATGKNPLFSCADCGALAMTEQGYDFQKDVPLDIVDDNGNRLCVACWLGHHPSYIVEFRRQGTPLDVIQRAQKLADEHAGASPAPAPPPTKSTTANEGAAAGTEAK